MVAFRVVPVALLSDNYGYVIVDSATGDAGESFVGLGGRFFRWA